MPLYEYRCDACQKRFTVLVGVVSGVVDPACPRCKAINVTKLVSRFSSPRSDDDRLDRLSESADPNDPASLRRLVREMKGELGDEFGEDLDEMMDEAEAEEAEFEGSSVL